MEGIALTVVLFVLFLPAAVIVLPICWVLDRLTPADDDDENNDGNEFRTLDD